ncbi:hypothetical protein I5F18_21275 [Bacillus halotolerans]|uniref:hypothetical protein n=1 Tax=Bacillus halotolerans TaxID=260554 RepID=UPI00192AE10C|nr:hypothetical protein [Bacillus halotolerans]MBL4974821.1 hypothetical protein [Bacillus halotolerans]
MSELKPLIEYIDGIKKQFADLKESLKGMDLDTALKEYEKGRAEIQKGFIEQRKDDYLSHRETILYGTFEAEHGEVSQGEPRHTSRHEGTVQGPEGMVFESLAYNPSTEKGKTSKTYLIHPGNQAVHVVVTATARYRGEGRSHIRIQPSITWKYEEGVSEANAIKDWNEIDKIVNR